jgi:peptidoglycan/xylan/chitin deacetylase (PgdA/CDA1 family)
VRHLDEIAAAGLTPELVSAFDLSAPGRRLLLTFDDGGRSAVDIGDALARRGWRAHFFIVTARIGTRGFVDAAGIRHLDACGHLIGSHSHTHPDIFSGLTAARMRDEWETSRDILAQILCAPCVAASIPGGDLSPSAIATAGMAGMGYVLTSEPWLEPRRIHGVWAVGRASMKAGMTPSTVRALVEFRGWRRALVERQLKVLARRSLAPLYRAYVRRTTRADITPTHASGRA